MPKITVSCWVLKNEIATNGATRFHPKMSKIIFIPDLYFPICKISLTKWRIVFRVQPLFLFSEMLKKLVNILLIVVLTVTILPIKQVGSMLFKNQWTEELNDHSEQHEKKQQPEKWTCLTHHDLVNQALGNANGVVQFFAYSQRLPVNPSGEIHSPPPNFC
jgi:hypothetical protein